MRQNLLSSEEVLKGYDVVSQLYPYIPSMSIWRAWECAAYRRYTLSEPVLDLGCGDGRFFRLVWPQLRDVVGVEMDLGVADAARRSGIYREVIATSAHKLPVKPESFAAAFANCSLEHMDHLPEVLSSVYRSLRPNGAFLCSVVTDKFMQWATLPLLVEKIGERQRAQALQVEYEMYHHLRNPLPPHEWREHLAHAGFEVVEQAPIVPEIMTRLFLFIDHLWHVSRPDDKGELGDVLFSYLTTFPHFPHAFRRVLTGILQMEQDWSIGSGSIFWARRKG